MNTDKDKKVDLLFEDLTYKIIGAAIEAHKIVGPGYFVAFTTKARGTPQPG